jgi:hypothetical protein
MWTRTFQVESNPQGFPNVLGRAVFVIPLVEHIQKAWEQRSLWWSWKRAPSVICPTNSISSLSVSIFASLTVLFLFFYSSWVTVLKLPWFPWTTGQIDKYLYDKGTKLPTSNSESHWTNHLMMMRLYPGAGVIISWKPDCSPQVMTVIITSPEPLAEPLVEWSLRTLAWPRWPAVNYAYSNHLLCFPFQ